jgi:hypothetical protein
MSLRDDVRQMAMDHARSGRHIDYTTIESQLASEGFPEAYVVLSDTDFRATLKAICKEHWRPRSK